MVERKAGEAEERNSVGVGAVVYARLSEDHERAESVPTQIANGTKYAERMGWEVVRVFKDKGLSGYTGELRPGFEEMIKFLGGGQADVLIARHHDRLARYSDHFARLLQLCGKAKSRSVLHRRRAGSFHYER